MYDGLSARGDVGNMTDKSSVAAPLAPTAETTVDSSHPFVVLSRRFLYQNPRTGEVASHPLTARQLCRLLCPPSVPSSSNTVPTQQHVRPPQIVTPDSNLLPLREENEIMGGGGEDYSEEEGGGDDGQGGSNNGNDRHNPYGTWQPARELPVFAAAAALWYYETFPTTTTSTIPPVSTIPAGTATAAEEEEVAVAVPAVPVVAGPVTCRDLARMIRPRSDEPPTFMDVDVAPSIASSSDWEKWHREQRRRRRVYSETVAPAWTTLEDLPHLQIALEAFDDDNDNNIKINSDPGHGADASQLMTAASASEEPAIPEEPEDVGRDRRIRDELEAFLSSTDRLGRRGVKYDDDDDDDNDEAYESDGGTRYVKDLRTGNWVHEALLDRARTAAQAPSSEVPTKLSSPPSKRPAPSSATDALPTKKKKSKGAKFSAKRARNWIYVQGLPPDTTEDELIAFCGKAGILDLNPATQRPKIKLYRVAPSALGANAIAAPHESSPLGPCKGDASVCYARPESVSLAVTLLDEASFRPTATEGLQFPVRVEPAKFEARPPLPSTDAGGGDDAPSTVSALPPPIRPRVSNAQRRVAKLAARQAVDWDGGDYNGRLTGGRKGLRIVVLKGAFDPADLRRPASEGNVAAKEEDARFAALEKDLRDECEAHGDVEKMTVFARNPEGVVVIKFAKPAAASAAVQAWNGRTSWKHAAASGRPVEATFWDGVTDYTVRDDEGEAREADRRHEDFGKWLDNQELPEELQLKTD